MHIIALKCSIHTAYVLHVSAIYMAIFREVHYKVLFWTSSILYICIASKTSVIFVMHLLEDGHISGRDLYEVYGTCEILLYTYVH